MSIHDPDPNALRDWTDPPKRLRSEAICLGRALMPDGRTYVRTIVTLVLLAVWVIATLGPAFNASDPINSTVHVGLTALVFLLVGHLWGLEVNKVLSGFDGVTVHVEQGADDDQED